MSRLQEFYTQKAVPQLMERLQIKNVMAVPRISKITLNMGVGEAIAEKRLVFDPSLATCVDCAA